MEYKCRFCNKTFGTDHGLKTHLGKYCKTAKEEKLEKEKNYKYLCRACGKRLPTDNSLHGHKGNCEKWREYVKAERERILTKQFLYEELVINKHSAKHIADLLNNELIDARNIIDTAKCFKVKTMNLKEAANNRNTRNKFKKTCLEKYGAENTLSKNTIPYKKRNKTVKRRYGVDNVFQLEEVKGKSRDTLYKKYGVVNPIDLPWRKNNAGRKSKEHKIIEDILVSNNIPFESEVNGKFKKFNNFYGKYYSPIPDILIEDKKVIIEVNGDYWHANPDKYKKTDLIKRYKGWLTAEEIWEKDKARELHLESFGYKVLYIWTSEIKAKRFNLLCKELKLKI